MVVYYETAAIGANRRRHRRTKAIVSGRYTSNGRVNDCVVLNLSLGGALLKADRSATASGPMVLTVLRAGALRCETVWRLPGKLAVRFLDDADQVAARIGQLLPACGYAPPTDKTEAAMEGKEAVELAAAAARLSLPAGTVQLALERGIIDGFRDARGRWHVLLDSQHDFSPEIEEEDAEAPDDSVVSEVAAAAEAQEAPPAPPTAAPGVPPESVEPADLADLADLAGLAGQLRDELRDLRGEILRRDDGGRDATIITLIDRFADISQAIVQRIPPSDVVLARVERSVAAQQEVTAKHEQDIRAIKDVLALVRDYIDNVPRRDRG